MPIPTSISTFMDICVLNPEACTRMFKPQVQNNQPKYPPTLSKQADLFDVFLSNAVLYSKSTIAPHLIMDGSPKLQ